MTRSSRALLAAVLTIGAAKSTAFADEIDDYGKKVFEVESKANELNASFRPPPPVGPELAERRLVDAQLLYQLKNYDEAAILLLDVVERFPNSRAYSEALFLLADCLYQKRDYLSARRHFTTVVERGPGQPGSEQGRRYQEALQRLIELSLRTEDFGPVEGYLARLREVPPSQLLPSVPYVEAKYYYFRGRPDEAAAVFERIPAGSQYYFQARYFVGTLRVQKRDLAAAVPVFEDLIHRQPKNDDDRRVQELAHMALGRLHYERSEFQQAVDEYQKVARSSSLFGDMLYEVAWTFIKNREFDKAYRALDLLLLAAPNSQQAPEVRILIGNLQVRQGKLGPAINIFEKARDEFEPVKNQLQDVLDKHADARAYFNELIGKNLERFDIAVYLPPQVVKWVRGEPEVGRVVQVVGDISDMKRAVRDSEDLIGRLERAVNGPAKVNIFPELASARERSLMLSNVLLDARTRLGAKQRQLVAPALSPSERQQLDSLGQQRMQLEQRLAHLPTSADGYTQRTQRTRAYIEELDHRGSELNVDIQSMNAELVAAEKYYRDTRATQKASAQEFQRLVDENRAVIEQLRQQLEELRNELVAAREMSGVGDAMVQQEEQDKARLRELLAQERGLLDRATARVAPDARMKLSQIESILARAVVVEQALAAFDAKIDGIVDQRLVDVKAAIAEEKGHLGEYKAKTEGFAGESADVGGGITFASFRNIAKRFYEIVVHADVGIIDVAWASKQSKTDAAARIKREETREIKLLDDEFKDVLQEEK